MKFYKEIEGVKCFEATLDDPIPSGSGTPEDRKNRVIIIDTETTGLEKSDNVFLIQLYLPSDNMCFVYDCLYNNKGKTISGMDYNTDWDKESAYLRGHTMKMINFLERLEKVIRHYKHTVFHNAQFDLRMLNAYYDFKINNTYCTMVTEKVKFRSPKWSLKATCEKYGVVQKQDAVMEYIKANNLHNGQRVKWGKEYLIRPRFYDVPKEIIYDYSVFDTLCTHQVYEAQRKLLDARA